MKRDAIVLLTILYGLGVASASASGAGTVTARATLKAVTLSESGSGGELFLHLNGRYTFATTQPAGDTLLIDVKGARLGEISKAAPGSGPLLAGYRLLQYCDATGEPVVRAQIELKRPGPIQVQRDRAGLRVRFGATGASAAPSALSTAVVATSAASSAPLATPPAPPAAAGPLEVSGVSVRTEKAGETIVDVATTAPAAYRVLQLKNPPRLVVDFEGARNGVPQRAYPASSDVLKGVRLGQFREKDPAVVRVVAELLGDPAFDVHAYPGGVRIELSSRSLAKAPPHDAVAAVPQARDRREVAAQPPVPSSPAKVEEKPLQAAVQPEYQSVLPASTAAAAAARPAPSARTPEKLQAVKAAQMLSADGTVLSATQAGAPGNAGAPQEAPKYTGEPISLNLKDVDLKDFFRLIHEISGLNIIVDPNVTGTVTLVLDDVPWDQALDIVLKNNGLGKQLEGNVLRIARVETLTAEQEAASKLAAAREEAMPLVTVFRPVNYAKAGTIATMLKSWVGGGALTKRGNILVDDRTNTLIISDIQSQIPIIQSIVSKLDTKAKQVVIEARIVLATASFSRTLSSALATATKNASGSTAWAASTGVSATANGVGAVGPLPYPVPANSVSALQPAATGFGSFVIANGSSRYLIEAAISAAETKSQAKTISRPTIVTQNNLAGTVLQGSQIPIQTTINNTISIQYTNATLTLTVTPQVTEDGNIFMNINVTNASPGPVLTTAGPSINTQSATTQVLVPDGGTVVFGGVTVTTRSRSATYIPLLGSIPIIGNLFKTSNIQDSDQELLFFVSPKVLTT